MRVILLVLYPFVYLLNSSGNAVLRLLRIPPQVGSHDQVYSPEELQIIVEESATGGALREESGWLLHELLTFGDLTAGEAMVPRVRVIGIAVGANPETVRRILRSHHHARYPIYEGDLDHIVGYIHIKELVALVEAGRPVTAADAHAIPQVPDTAPLDDVLAMFRRFLPMRWAVA